MGIDADGMTLTNAKSADPDVSPPKTHCRNAEQAGGGLVFQDIYSYKKFLYSSAPRRAQRQQWQTPRCCRAAATPARPHHHLPPLACLLRHKSTLSLLPAAMLACTSLPCSLLCSSTTAQVKTWQGGRVTHLCHT